MAQAILTKTPEDSNEPQINDKIEDGIAKMIIEGSAKSGTTIPAATLLKFLT